MIIDRQQAFNSTMLIAKDSYNKGRQDAFEEVDKLFDDWLMHESGKCLKCAENLRNDLNKLREKSVE